MAKNINKQVKSATKWSAITEITAKLITPITSVGANCVVTKDFMKDNILLTFVPAVIKSERSIWYVTDNKYAERIKLIEQLRQRVNI